MQETKFEDIELDKALVVQNIDLVNHIFYEGKTKSGKYVFKDGAVEYIYEVYTQMAKMRRNCQNYKTFDEFKASLDIQETMVNKSIVNKENNDGFEFVFVEVNPVVKFFKKMYRNIRDLFIKKKSVEITSTLKEDSKTVYEQTY